MRILRKCKQTLLSAGKCKSNRSMGTVIHFLGYDPVMEITCTDGEYENPQLKVREKEEITKQVAHPGDTSREILTGI